MESQTAEEGRTEDGGTIDGSDSEVIQELLSHLINVVSEAPINVLNPVNSSQNIPIEPSASSPPPLDLSTIQQSLVPAEPLSPPPYPPPQPPDTASTNQHVALVEEPSQTDNQPNPSEMYRHSNNVNNNGTRLPQSQQVTISAGNSMEIGAAGCSIQVSKHANGKIEGEWFGAHHHHLNQHGASAVQSSSTSVACDPHLGTQHAMWSTSTPLVALQHVHNKRYSYAGSASAQTGSSTGDSAQSLCQRLEFMQRELCELTSKNQVLSGKYRQLMHDYKNSTDDTQQLQHMISELKAEHRHTRSQCQALINEKTAVQQQSLDYKSRLESKTDEVNELRQHLSNAQGTAMQNGVATAAWRDNVFKQIEELRSENELLRQENEVLSDQTRLVDSLQRQLEVEANERHVNKERYRAEITPLYEQLHRLTQENELLKVHAESSRQRHHDAEVKIQTTRANIQHLSDSVTLWEARYKQIHNEYTNIMSERDVVLKENEELSGAKDRLQDRLKKLEHSHINMEQQTQIAREQLLQLQKQHHQHWQDQPATADDTTSDTGIVSEQRSLTSSESEVADLTRIALEKDLHQFKQQLEDMHRQMMANREEVEEARHGRDWAIQERKRIVSERESMRAMCDQLRRERDDAITKLADAISNTDDLQRQRDSAHRQLNEFKSKFELDLVTLSSLSSGAANQMNRNTNCVSPSHSRDSAIDNDLAEWEIDTVELSLNGSTSKNEDSLGVELRGGRDELLGGVSVPVYVKSVAQTSRFDGVLRVFDCILQVNEIDVSNMERRSVLDILRNSKNVKMSVKRRRLLGMKVLSVPVCPSESDCGVSFEDGVYISKLQASSVAAKAGNLAIGDRIIFVNDVPVAGKSAHEINSLVHELSPQGIVFAVVKSPPLLSPMTPSISFQQFARNNNNIQNQGTKSPVATLDVQCQTTPSEGAQNHQVKSRSKTSAGTAGGLNSAHSDGHITGSVHSNTESIVSNHKTVSSSSNNNMNAKSTSKSKGTLIDRILGRTDRKQRTAVLATANVSSDTLRASSSTSSSHHRVKLRDFSWGTGPRNAANELLMGKTKRNRGAVNRNTIIGQSLDEERVMQHFDDILQGAEAPSRSASSHGAGAGAGSTWPKYQHITDTNVLNRTHLRGDSDNPKAQNQTFDGNNEQQQMDVARYKVTQTPKKRGNVFDVFPNNDSNDINSLPASHHVSDLNRSINTADQMSSSHSAQLQQHQKQQINNQKSINSINQQQINVNNSQPRVSQPITAYPVPPAQFGTLPNPSSYTQAARNYETYATLNKQNISRAKQRAAPPPYPGTSHPRQHQQQAQAPMIESDYQSVTSQSSLSMNSTRGGTPSGHRRYAPRNSPFQTYSTDDAQSNASHSRMHIGSVRTIRIEKGTSRENLGFSIHSPGHGVFISRVSETSLAAKSGVQVGDQLLQICGINLANADADAAKKVLCHLPSVEHVEMVVQYNPQQMSAQSHQNMAQQPNTNSDLMGWLAQSSQSGHSTPRHNQHVYNQQHLSRQSSLHSASAHSREILGIIAERGEQQTSSNAMNQGPYSVFTHNNNINQTNSNINNMSTSTNMSTSVISGRQTHTSTTSSDLDHTNRLVYVRCRDSNANNGSSTQVNDGCNCWGMAICGGNSLGIFVDKLVVESSGPDSLLVGDQLIEFNGIDFRHLTLEQATYELQRKSDSVIRAIVQYSESKYGRAKRAGDSFYVRVNVDRPAETADELALKAGDILYVDNTLFLGRTGRWRAWLLDQEGRQNSCGIIPSKLKLEEELMMKRSPDMCHSLDMLEDARKRPVMIVGALYELLVGRLVQTYPMFERCVPECMQISQTSLEQGMVNLLYIDFRKRQQLFEVTSTAVVKEKIDRGLHCILDVSLGALERLQQLQIYPIVVVVKFKNAKQIREIFETAKRGERLSSKQAKEIWENAQQMEQQLQKINCPRTFATAPQQQQAELSLRALCQQISSAVEHEQKKTLWVVSPQSI